MSQGEKWVVHLGQITRHKIKDKNQQSLLRACLGFLYGIQSSAVAMDTGTSSPVSRGRTDVVARNSQSCLWIRTEATLFHTQKCVPVETRKEAEANFLSLPWHLITRPGA